MLVFLLTLIALSFRTIWPIVEPQVRGFQLAQVSLHAHHFLLKNGAIAFSYVMASPLLAFPKFVMGALFPTLSITTSMACWEVLSLFTTMMFVKNWEP